MMLMMMAACSLYMDGHHTGSSGCGCWGRVFSVAKGNFELWITRTWRQKLLAYATVSRLDHLNESVEQKSHFFSGQWNWSLSLLYDKAWLLCSKCCWVENFFHRLHIFQSCQSQNITCSTWCNTYLISISDNFKI